MCDTIICRICLSADVKMYPLNAANFQDIFQTISNCELRANGKPQTACYMCYRNLQNCETIRKRCRKAEEILNNILQYSKITKSSLAAVKTNKKNLSCVLSISSVVNVKCNSLKPHNFDANDIKNKNNELRNTMQDDVEILEVYSNSNVKKVTDLVSYKDDKCDMKNKFNFQHPHQTHKETFEKCAVASKASFQVNNNKQKVKKIKKHENESLDRSREEFFAKNESVDTKPSYCRILLSQEEQNAEFLLREHSANYVSALYKCEMCYKGYVSCEAYKRHMDKHEEDYGQFECGICHLRYKNKIDLSRHLRLAHARRYKCCLCQTVFLSRQQMIEHQNWHRGHKFHCKICTETFDKSSSCFTHMRLKHPSEFICQHCGCQFLSRNSLDLHRKKHHPYVDRLPECLSNELLCAVCRIRFFSNKALAKHLYLNCIVSSHDKSYCPICLHEFINKDEKQKRKHYLSHVKASVDETRDVNCVKRKNVATEKLNKCDLCPAKFYRLSTLHNHINKEHLKKELKSVVCELCGTHFKNKSSLTRHLLTHSDSRPHDCPECGKKFKNAVYLKIHRRRHTGEKPYACDVCSRRFTQKTSLNVHRKIHSGNKLYKCHICDKAFIQAGTRTRHIERVHHLIPHRFKGDSTN